MRMKYNAHRWAVGSAVIFLFVASTCAISVNKSKGKSEQNNADKLSAREGLQYSEDSEDQSVRLEKRSQNVTTGEGKTRKLVKKEDSPSTDLEDDLEDIEQGDEKSEFNREVRGDKSPRIYYDDTTSSRHRHPHSGAEGSNFDGASPEGRQKNDGKLYYPKNYMTSKTKKGNSLIGSSSSGKRNPDNVEFNEGDHHSFQHEYPEHHGHSIPVDGHHEEHHGPHHVEQEAPYAHGIEEHHGKGHGHLNVYHGHGYHGHYHGSYRHTLGDKVDVLGRALRVLVPSALLVTGVSALFPNRVHVPTTPNKYRQKRSVFRRRSGRRGPPAEPRAHIAPEVEDIPSHILEAEHRYLDSGVMLEPEYHSEFGRRYAASSQSFMAHGGFNPFGVFKGPGPEHDAHKMEESIRLPGFEGLPEMATLSDKNEYHVQTRFQEGGNYAGQKGHDLPISTYGPGNAMHAVPPTINSIPDRPTTEMSRGKGGSVPPRRKKTTRKPPMYLKEVPNMPQHPMDTHKQNYLVKNALTDTRQDNPVKAEEEFMSTLQNLVTPDVAKAIVENKQQEPPKNVDLSPDGPVMGLLSSYAQHEKDSPICQKRALCELAVKGNSSKASKFESFLWSVATLVPDVFSEMYDLQEVFHAIRNEKCGEFQCINPNLDLQVN